LVGFGGVLGVYRLLADGTGRPDVVVGAGAPLRDRLLALVLDPFAGPLAGGV